MQRRILILALCTAAAGASLAGCGQKGPLYLPEDEEDKEEREKAREKQSTTGRDTRRSPA